MSNPAAELYEIFEQWRTSTKTSNAARRKVNTPAGVELVVRAMHLVHEIGGEIDRLEAVGRRVNAYRENYQAWVYAIIAYRTGWQANTAPDADLPVPVMHALDVLADTLDNAPASTRTPEITVAFKAIEERLARVLAAVNEDETLDSRLKLHIRRVVAHLQTCMAEFETYGKSRTAEAFDDLWVAMTAAAGQSEKKSMWEKLRDDLVLPATAGAIGGLPAVVIQLAEITGSVSM